MSTQNPKPTASFGTSHRHKGIYLLPNLLTTAGLFFGFYAMIAAIKGHFESTAIALFIAMIADALDGRVARLVHANTEFGVQYDSIADMVSFGVAPSIALYCWSLHSLGKLGWLLAFLYAACVALRLARFNVQAEQDEKRYFIGLPCPPAAAVIAALIWLVHAHGTTALGVSVLVAIITTLIALLMISNFRYRSFKEIDFKGRTPSIYLVFVIFLFVAISMNPPMVLFIGFSLYAISGPVYTTWRLKQHKQRRSKKVKGDQSDV